MFTGGTICSHGYCHILHVGMPVHVGGLTVSNGDLLHGDLNGVTRIPLEIADQIPEVAAELVNAEKLLIDFARSREAKSLVDWAQLRKEFSADIAELTKRVRRIG